MVPKDLQLCCVMKMTPSKSLVIVNRFYNQRNTAAVGTWGFDATDVPEQLQLVHYFIIKFKK